MEKLKMILEVLKQRRVWAAIVASLIFGFHISGVTFPYQEGSLTDIMTTTGTSIAVAVEGILALWSYLKPKK
jgi:cell shape-determining protein MreC